MKKKLFHIYLFTFGFVYYLVLPYVVVCLNILDDYPGMDWLYEYNIMNHSKLYITCCFYFYLSFIMGSLFPLLFYRKSFIYRNNYCTISRKDQFIFISPIIMLALGLTVVHRGDLFQGYRNEYDATYLGQIATTNLILLFWFIYNRFKFGLHYNKFDKLFLILLIVFSIVLLGLGSRMYVLLPIISYLLYAVDVKLLKPSKIILYFAVFTILLLLVGLWRVGQDFSFEDMLYIGIAEPCFTWISAISMFDKTHEIACFYLPYNYISSFLNFLPTMLVPDKISLISPISLPFDAPLGARSVLLSVISNFGLVGGCLFLFMFGSFFSVIRLYGNKIFWKVYYICICSILPFQFFRDELSIINKMIFFNFLFVPIVMKLTGRLCINIKNKYNFNYGHHI